MKKFMSVLFVLVFYVVVNKDASIHTIARKADDVLSKGQKRYVIDTIPDNYRNIDYYWGSEGLTKKNNEEIAEINAVKNENIRKINFEEAYNRLETIKKIEVADSEADYSKEKAKYEGLVNQYKKPKKDNI